MKKVLSLVLVIAMVLSSMSFAFASTFEDVTGDYEKAIDALSGLGIITGYEDGTFRPENVVTRAEMAKLMVEILGYGDLVSGAKSNFTDTQGHWADAWIAIAAGRNIVIGDGNGQFRPDAQVSYNEVLTMVVRGLGYTDDSNEIKSMSWPTNFKVKAAEIGITDDVVMNATGADRGGVAQALYNALEATLVTVDTEGNTRALQDQNNRDKLLLSRIADEKVYEIQPGHINEDSNIYLGDIVDLESYMYQTLTVYVNDDGDVVYVKGSDSLVVEGEIADVTANNVEIEDADGNITRVPYKTIKNANMYLNGEETEMPEISVENKANLKKYENVKIVAFEEDDKASNGKIEADEIKGIVVDNQTKAAQVDQAFVEGKTKVDTFELPVDANKKVVFDQVKVEGAVESIEDIQEDDVVVEYAAKDKKEKVIETRLVVSRDTIEGKVTKIDSVTKAVTIDGTKYSLNKLALSELELGSEGTFYLDHNGKIVEFSGNTIYKYAAVIGYGEGETTTRFGKSIKTYPQLKVRTAEGEVIVFDLYITLKDDAINKTLELDGENIDFVFATVDSKELIKVNGVDKLDALEGKLIEYSLNKDGKIDSIEIEEILETNEIDKEDAEYKLADNVVIFNKNHETYAVASVERLEDPFQGQAGYNKNGEIVALLTEDVKDGTDYTFAFVEQTNETEDADGDEVLEVIAYMNGEKVTYLTDGSTGLSEGTINAIYGIELDGETIIDAIPYGDVEDTATPLEIAKVTSISTATNSLLAGDRYYLTGDATIVELNEDGEVDRIADLYDLKERTDVVVYRDKDNTNDHENVVFVTYGGEIEEEDEEDEVVGIVTYINAEDGIIRVDGKNYEVSNTVELYVTVEGDDDRFVAVGMSDVLAALTSGDEVVELVVEDDVVTSIVVEALASEEEVPPVVEEPITEGTITDFVAGESIEIEDADGKVVVYELTGSARNYRVQLGDKVELVFTNGRLTGLTIVESPADDAAAALVAAKADLATAMKDAQDLHDNATEGTDNEEYAVGSKVTLKAAIDAAQAIADNATATLAQVEAAESTLANAVTAFEATQVEEAGDSTDLVAAISDAQDLHDNATEGTDNEEYAVGSKATLQAVINAVNAVVVKTNPSAKAAELAQAETVLANAVTAFEATQVEEAGDPTDLVAAISDAQDLYDNATEGLLAGNYAMGSKAVLLDAIDDAQAVVDETNPSATAAELAQAEADLANAVAAFEAAEIK